MHQHGQTLCVASHGASAPCTSALRLAMSSWCGVVMSKNQGSGWLCRRSVRHNGTHIRIWRFENGTWTRDAWDWEAQHEANGLRVSTSWTRAEKHVISIFPPALKMMQLWSPCTPPRYLSGTQTPAPPQIHKSPLPRVLQPSSLQTAAIATNVCVILRQQLNTIADPSSCLTRRDGSAAADYFLQTDMSLIIGDVFHLLDALNQHKCNTGRRCCQ